MSGKCNMECTYRLIDVKMENIEAALKKLNETGRSYLAPSIIELRNIEEQHNSRHNMISFTIPNGSFSHLSDLTRELGCTGFGVSYIDGAPIDLSAYRKGNGYLGYTAEWKQSPRFKWEETEYDPEDYEIVDIPRHKRVYEAYLTLTDKYTGMSFKAGGDSIDQDFIEVLDQCADAVCPPFAEGQLVGMIVGDRFPSIDDGKPLYMVETLYGGTWITTEESLLPEVKAGKVMIVNPEKIVDPEKEQEIKPGSDEDVR